jgi:cystathionine beta-lyase
MNDFDFDHLIDRQETWSDKWSKYAGTDTLPMWVADTDFRSPRAVIEALKTRVDHGVFGYTRSPETLNQVFINRMQRLYDWTISAEDLVWLPGLVCGLNLATRALSTAEQAVVTAQPIYPPFMSAPALSSRDLITIPMNDRVIDFDALEKAITAETKLLLFCNPHNPGGGVYRREELERLAQIIINHDLFICSDEIHCDLILQPELRHTPIASLNEEIASRTLTLMAPSKTWNIAGLACSVAIIQNPELRERFKKVRKGIVPDVNLLGYTAAEAAYSFGDEWNRKQCEYLKGNRDYLIAEIGNISGLNMQLNEATYLAWIDARQLGVDNPQRLFESHGVGLSDGQDFGAPGFVRLNFGCPRSRVEEAVHRIKLAVASL